MKCLFRTNEFKRLRLLHPFITWGVFDGVHRGHQKTIGALTHQAHQHKGSSIILTFKIHPDKTLGKHPPLNITSLKHRLRLFEQLGVDIVLVLPFHKRFSQIKPENFIRDILVKKLKVKGIVVSRGTKFGKNRAGNIRLLKNLCKKYNLSLTVVPPLKHQGKTVSSTRIRESIRTGKLDEAMSMLGRSVSLLGTVVKGSGRGRKLGFPTANLKPAHELTPPNGVYAGQVRLNKRIYHTLTNIGQRPTFITRHRPVRTEPTVETHVLGFKKPKKINLYGQELEVQLFFKLRNERKFSSPDELVKQIKQDETYLRHRYLTHRK